MSSSSLTSSPLSPPTALASASSSPSPFLSAASTPNPAGSSISITPSPLAVGQGYLPKVSFDTFENPAAPIFSFTLQAKSEGYRRNRNTRVFLCAASPDESGTEALDWAIESLVQEGDELIVFRGFDTEELGTQQRDSSCCGFKLTRNDTVKDHDAVREDAKELMRQIKAKNIEYDADRKVCRSVFALRVSLADLMLLAFHHCGIHCGKSYRKYR